MADIFGMNKDIPAPDMGTGKKEMAWLLDEFNRIHGEDIPGVVTGKPITLGGSKGREAATGRGVMISSLAAMKKIGLNHKQATASVQGFGNVGSHAARLLVSKSIRVNAISDHTAAFYNEKGIDIDAALKYASSNGNVLKGFKGGDEISAGEVLTVPVDLLVPAAIQGVITAVNAGDIKAKLIVEGAQRNCGCTGCSCERRWCNSFLFRVGSESSGALLVRRRSKREARCKHESSV
jgi:glutamate dehydrogenase (NAD(P)+)